MTGGIVGFVLVAILIPLLVNEAGDLARSLARCLLRWGARRIGRADQAQRYEEEWLADLERVPGNLTKLGYACGVVIRSVPRLRAQFRQGPRGARLPGILPGRIMDAIGEQLAGSLEIDATLQHVAEMLVPQFADHCFIDLFQGDALICRVRLTPAAGHRRRAPGSRSASRSCTRRGTSASGRWRAWTRSSSPTWRRTGEDYPPPSAQSYATAKAGGADIGPRRASVCPRGAARRDESGPVGPDRQNRTTLRHGGPVPHRRDREPGRGRDRPRDNCPGTSARPRRPLINRTRNILAIAAGGTSPGGPTSAIEGNPEEGRGFQSNFGGTTEIMKEIIACDLTGLRT